MVEDSSYQDSRSSAGLGAQGDFRAHGLGFRVFGS